MQNNNSVPFSNINDYNLHSIYQFVSIVENNIMNGVEIFNYNPETLIDALKGFSKISILNIYCTCSLLNNYNYEFRKNSDCMEESTIKGWEEIFDNYKVEYKNETVDFEQEDAILNWYKGNEASFMDLFEILGDCAAYVIFADKNLLTKFNLLMSNFIINIKDYCDDYSGLCYDDIADLLNDNYLKRKAIPKWTKTAIFHRDKGRCVYCNKDLSGVVVMNTSNYDHIIPLAQGGWNDPCNIQLTCETCNKSKGKHIKPILFRNYKWW